MLYPISEPIPGREENAHGYINDDGEIVVPLSYLGAGHFFEGKAAVLNSAGKSGFIDCHGNLLISHKFDGLGRFHAGLCPTGGGYIDHDGDWVIERRYLVASAFSEGLAFVTADGESFGYIDQTAKFVIPPKFRLCKHFSEGLAAVCVDGRWGYIDRKGRLAIPTVFEGPYATGFREGLAGVRMDGHCGFINRRGKFMLKPEYEDVGPFLEGTARVRKHGKWGVINEEGKNVIACKFDELRQIQSGIAPAKLDGKAGFISRDGAWLIEPSFDRSYEFFGDLAVVKKGSVYSYVNRIGKIVWTSARDALTKLPPAPLFV